MLVVLRLVFVVDVFCLLELAVVIRVFTNVRRTLFMLLAVMSERSKTLPEKLTPPCSLVFFAAFRQREQLRIDLKHPGWFTQSRKGPRLQTRACFTCDFRKLNW